MGEQINDGDNAIINGEDAINTNLVFQTKSRSSTIIEPFVGKCIAVYNGKRSKRVYITEEKIGYKLGCFSFTKKMGKSIHNSEHNRKKIAKMKRKITQKKVRKTSATPKAKAKKKIKKK